MQACTEQHVPCMMLMSVTAHNAQTSTVLEQDSHTSAHTEILPKCDLSHCSHEEYSPHKLKYPRVCQARLRHIQR